MNSVAQRVYGSLRAHTPRPLRRPLSLAMEQIGGWTSFARLLPSFLIVGGQRCGTNSLYEYLVRHPCIGRALPTQEIHFFDLNFCRGLEWYRGHFPLRIRHPLSDPSSRLITGESSPYYMFHPLAPLRIAQLLPNVKIVALLRNPVDRAYSAYQYKRAQGIETLPFDEAIDKEKERLSGEVERMKQEPTYLSFNHRHFSYLARGLYIDQLENLFSLFPSDNILVLVSEKLFVDPAAAYSTALQFVGLPPLSLPSYPKHNSGRYSNLDPKVRRQLTDYFEKSNERLYRFLNTDFRWE